MVRKMYTNFRRVTSKNHKGKLCFLNSPYFIEKTEPSRCGKDEKKLFYFSKNDFMLDIDRKRCLM